MPLPPHKLTIRGGCNCGAIKYEISIPEIAQRPLHPSSSATDILCLPFIATDHCNDCRSALGTILPMWICSPISMIKASVVLRSKASLPSEASKRKNEIDEPRTPYLPAHNIFTPGSISEDSFLMFFESSENRRRSFCGRCGTNISYAALPMPEGWPDMLDIVLGTVDREDLSGEALKPERQLWWDCGIEWIKDMSVQGVGEVPRHPDYKVDVVDEGK
ncbi:Mss4-like protein [Glarea lozoyensis ATCC 20868]|uniref:Mss4-like protein n=1 Tax=Glarea lozoyensis (strain ATCC 20868 / MF5171) TaxID=1116229 RepID=S3D4Q3_GLAL2|nr:Mss4-like protein [Glarea lozoyensis ATCC 20868]EPE27056.1 Mss4-like protein [Glarea lozoyensis ATCC 20868]